MEEKYCKYCGKELVKHCTNCGDNDKALTKQEARDKGLYIFYYNNGDYEYHDEDKIEHLIRNGREIAKGLFVFSYNNGDYEYRDENKIEHYSRIIDGAIWERK